MLVLALPSLWPGGSKRAPPLHANPRLKRRPGQRCGLWRSMRGGRIATESDLEGWQVFEAAEHRQRSPLTGDRTRPHGGFAAKDVTLQGGRQQSACLS